MKYLYTAPRRPWMPQYNMFFTDLSAASVAALYSLAKTEDAAEGIRKIISHPQYTSRSVPVGSHTGDAQIHYHWLGSDPQQARGVYAISVYVRKHAQFGSNYKKFWRGIHAYTEMMEAGRPFEGWRLIIYTDYYSARIMEIAYEYEYHQRLPSSVVLAIVEWPEQAEPNVGGHDQIDNALLRCMRFRALVDWVGRPVAIRDADTIYYKYWKDFTPADVRAGEAAFWRRFAARPEPFSFSSQPEYTNDFHTDILCGDFKIRPGTFAGFVNSKGVADWRDGLWDECLQYILERRHVRPELPGSGNIPDATKRAKIYIGKDEQALLFRAMPRLLNKSYFFLMEYTVKVDLTSARPRGRGLRLMSPAYVDAVFEGAYHEKMLGLFREQVVKYKATCRPNS